MKVGVLIEFTSNTDIDAKFAELKEMGVDSCQLVCWDRSRDMSASWTMY